MFNVCSSTLFPPLEKYSVGAMDRPSNVFRFMEVCGDTTNERVNRSTILLKSLAECIGKEVVTPLVR
ncbi:hypothetical protein JTE90_002319 [Oedothorax gibbosus]|uniref:Uncharacterized protein n=1 Tax=Oedothorax gibbosus TaxID=931172 RepID=A0AAV6UK29_9ARAC|nr:hypothetical protein JTE90_002319 [Oedothorax gibbosus]